MTPSEAERIIALANRAERASNNELSAIYGAREDLIAALSPAAVIEMAKAMTERDALRASLAEAEQKRDFHKRMYDNEYAVVDRVWQALGMVNYEQTGGNAIWEIVSDLHASLAEAERERADFYMNYRMKCDEETKRLESALAAVTAERDEAVTWIRVVGEECVLSGYPGGDRNVTLANIRAAIKERDAYKRDAERYRAIRDDSINPMCMFSARADDELMVGVESMLTGAELDAAIDATQDAQK